MRVEDTWNRRGPDGKMRRTDRYGTGLRWRARWREHGTQRAKSFRTKDAAEAHLREVAEQVARPQVASGTVGEWLSVWWQTKQRLAPTTVADYESLYTQHVQPRWGATPADEVRHSEVLAWANGLQRVGDTHGLSSSRANRAVLVLKQALALAVKDGALAANPAEGVRVKASQRREAMFLDREQIRALLEAAGRHRPLVHLVVTTGLRWGEVAGLTVGSLDAPRRRLRVARTLSTVGSALVPQNRTKGGKAREVPLTAAVTAELAEVARGRRKAEHLFVTTRGNPWRHSSWEREWEQIKDRAGIPEGFLFHDLRHTAASLAIASGADVKKVQAMLGHASATMTMDLYGHLWDDDMTTVADRIDGLLGGPEQIR